MPITTEIVLQQVRNCFRDLGLTVPKPVAAAFTDTDNFILKFDHAERGAAGVLKAALAAQADGRDPATDEAVRTALTRMLLVHHSGAITAAQESEQENARKAALVKHAPALIETMRAVVEAADRDIANAREVLGTDKLRLDDQKMIGALDSTRLAPWAVAREALLRVERVEEIWVFLASATRLAAVSDNTKALIVTDADDLTPISQRNRGFDVVHNVTSARSVVEAGLPLSLATFEQYRDRVAAVRAREQSDAERARERAELRMSLNMSTS
ncbi:hypothetical protein [Nocardioides lijunqiniae]|uniref:hypothetical protein n=1 Tax=Nocardioides lijunqiniae TaxID=2760832 RepID=UPI0018776DC7|nr:hypothetical protein [Nocardioides lijunqiniae]